jgi:hypothetical protein
VRVRFFSENPFGRHAGLRPEALDATHWIE